MGGKTSKVWGKEQIISITHTTTEENLLSILKSGAVKSPYGKNPEDFKITRKKFPGVYCSVHTIYDIHKKNINPITIVFSKKILDAYNYHFNLIENDGYINENTLVNQTMSLYPPQKDVESFFIDYKGNELVFHDDIPIHYIEEIWISKSLFISENKVSVRSATNTLKYIQHLLYSHNLGHYVSLLKKQKKIPDKVYNKDIQIDIFKKPYLCYFIDRDHGGNKHFDFNIKPNDRNLMIPFVYRNVLSSTSKTEVWKTIAEYGGVKIDSTDKREIEKAMINDGCITRTYMDRKSQNIKIYPPFLELYNL